MAAIKVGFWTGWDRFGKKAWEGAYKADPGNNQRVGHWTQYYDGWKSSEGEYKNGHQEGLWTDWYSNGQKKREATFKNGKEEGRWAVWYENGQKNREGEVKNGKREGRWTFWKFDGSIKPEESGIYKAGKRVAPLPKK